MIIPGINILSFVASDPFNYEYDFLLTPLDSSAIYSANLTKWADCSGNQMTDTSFSITIGSSPSPYDLIISEIFPEPNTEISPGLPVEYIEVYNRSGYPIRLNGLEGG